MLKDFSKSLKDKTVLLQIDNAPWHTSPKLHTPKNIHLVQQPPYSPELQPAERLWQLTDEPLKNQAFDTLDQLQQVLQARCVELQYQQQQIKALTLFHWWPLID